MRKRSVLLIFCWKYISTIWLQWPTEEKKITQAGKCSSPTCAYVHTLAAYTRGWNGWNSELLLTILSESIVFSFWAFKEIKAGGGGGGSTLALFGMTFFFIDGNSFPARTLELQMALGSFKQELVQALYAFRGNSILHPSMRNTRAVYSWFQKNPALGRSPFCAKWSNTDVSRGWSDQLRHQWKWRCGLPASPSRWRHAFGRRVEVYIWGQNATDTRQANISFINTYLLPKCFLPWRCSRKLDAVAGIAGIACVCKILKKMKSRKILKMGSTFCLPEISDFI